MAAGLALAAAAGAAAVQRSWRQGRGSRDADAALAAAAAEVCIVAPPTPYEPATGLPLEAPRAVPADARCPVCGMFPARSPQWAAQLIYADGAAHFFDSPLSLFQFLAAQSLYQDGRWSQRVCAAYVRDMGGSGWVAAAQATYVAGSSLLGPMRNGNYPSFASPEAARSFARQRGGEAMAAPLLADHVRATVPAAGHRHVA